MNNQAFKSYNEMLKNKEIHFWCNGAGDIEVKDFDLSNCIENMPPKYRNLYLNYWREDTGCYMCVSEWNDEPYMVLEILIDYEYKSNLEMEISKDISENRYWLAVQDTAQCLAKGYKQLEGLIIAAGKDTDEEGHHIVVLIPYDRRDEIESIAEFVNNKPFELVRELI